MTVVLGVDIGTYETKGVLLRADGTVVARARRQHRVTVPRPGFVEHDPETVWWAGFVEVTARLLAEGDVDPAEVAAVACSGIGPCVLPIDASGRPLRTAILYGVDTRADAQIAATVAALGEDEIMARSGTTLTSQSAGPKVSWLHDEEPEVFAAAAHFVTCQTFVTGRLTGKRVTDHATAAYYHPLYDRRTGDWNLDGVPGAPRRDQLPDLGWSSDVVGEITPTAAAATGLRAGTPVLVGAPDAAVEALSAGVRRPGDMMLMYGSSHFLIEVVDRPVSSAVLWPAPYVFRDSYIAAAGTATAGSFTRWYVDILAPGTESIDEVFTEIADLAARSRPGARGLLALPHLSGERTPLFDAGARGGFLGLSLEHDRGDMARAVLEGIAQSAAEALRAYEAESLAPSRIRAVGGGTKNAVWLQAISDISGYPQEVVGGSGAAQGDAMLAACAVGMTRPDRLDDWVDVQRSVAPRTELAPLYARQSAAYRAFYRATRDIVSDLNELRNHDQ